MEQETPKRFGPLLRGIRESKSIKLKELSDFLDVSLPYLSDVEKSRRDPLSNERILEVAKYLDTDPIPLLEAAAIDREKVVLPINQDSGDRRVKLAATLASVWTTIPYSTLGKILSLLRGG